MTQSLRQQIIDAEIEAIRWRSVVNELREKWPNHTAAMVVASRMESAWWARAERLENDDAA